MFQETNLTICKEPFKLIVALCMVIYFEEIFFKAMYRAGGMAQEVKHFPSKHEALSSNPSTAKKKFCTMIFMVSVLSCSSSID
jgi:hypothetical protein